MNRIQYKDLLSYNCLNGTVVESLSLTQEILGSNPAIFLFDCIFFLSLNSANSVKAFRENSNVPVMHLHTGQLLTTEVDVLKTIT